MKSATCPRCGKSCIFNVEILTKLGWFLEWTCYRCGVEFIKGRIK